MPSSDAIHASIPRLTRAAEFILYEMLRPVAPDAIRRDERGTIGLRKVIKTAARNGIDLDPEDIGHLQQAHEKLAGPLKHREATIHLPDDGYLAYKLLDIVLRLAEDHTDIDLNGELEFRNLWQALLEQEPFWRAHGPRIREDLRAEGILTVPCVACGIDALEQQTWRCIHCGAHGPNARCEGCGVPEHLVDGGLVPRSVEELELRSPPEHLRHLTFCSRCDPVGPAS